MRLGKGCCSSENGNSDLHGSHEAPRQGSWGGQAELILKTQNFSVVPGVTRWF